MSYTPIKEQLKMYEVTPLEHLEALKDIVVAKQNEEDIRLEQTIQYDIIQRELYEYNKLKTPPTEQEVCEALEKYLNEPVWVDKFDHIRLTTQWAANKIYLKDSFIGVNLHVVLPPRLITMIGKFYEGKVKDNEC